jgi:hypothetical protein
VISVSPPSSVSSRPSIWVLAGAPKLGQRSCREFPAALGRLHSSDQPFVGQPLSCRAVNEAVEPLQGMPLHIALIEPESELVNVPAKVLRADVVEGAVNAALQDGPDAFNAVGRNAVTRVFARPVIAQHDRLAAAASPDVLPPVAFVLVHVLRQAANPRFVDFNDAAQLVEVVAASLAQTPENEPGGLLGDADFLGELHGRDTLPRHHDEVHRVNPLMQRNVRPLENRTSANREILFALVAAIEAALARRDALAKPADRAADAVRPEAAFEINPRRLLIREHCEKLEGRNGAAGHRQALVFYRQYGGLRRGSQVYNSL